jgi:RNA polymerase sigma-70 factor (ECF subfamily)
MEPSDSELIRRFQQNGDREAFVLLVRRHKTALIHSLRGITRSPERAEELAQETFFIFYQHPEKYEDRGKLDAYLFRVGLNLHLKELRRDARFTHDEDLAEFPANQTPEEVALQNEAERLLMDTMEKLPPKLKRVMVAHDMDGLSFETIAAMTGSTPGAVRTALSRARKMVRDVLAPWWYGVRRHEERQTR